MKLPGAVILENEQTLKTSLTFVFPLTELIAPVVNVQRSPDNQDK